MKIALAIPLLILVAAGLIGWMGQREQLGEAQAVHSRLMSEAAALGILRIDPDDPDEELRVTKRERRAGKRTDNQAEAHDVAREVIAVARELEILKESGTEQDDAMQARIVTLIDKMLSLNGEQLEILISDFRTSPEVGEDIRSGILTFAIMTLAEEHPEAALKLFTEGGNDQLDFSMVKHQIPGVLTKFAAQDPDAALEWVRANSSKHPDLVTESVKNGLVKGAAERDMKLAFGLITELGIKDADDAIHGIANTLKDMKSRTEFLGLLRDFSEKNSEKEEAGKTSSALSILADGIAKEGFAAGSQWILENKLSPSESATLVGSIAQEAKGKDKGRWIEWMGAELTGEEREAKIETTMQQWTRSDYRAAGEWLAASPEGPAKAASVSAYAKTVAPHDPQIAAQWALTLPPGEKRRNTLAAIHDEWPQDSEADTQAREAFAREHEIK